MAHCLALYDIHYTLLRRQNMVDSVGRKTFLDYLMAESSGADYQTGRNARVTLDSLQVATRRSESTMHRCRRLLNKLGCRTVVFRGRHRTREERLESYRRDDRARGWSAVAALHESAVMPVDNSAVETLLEQGFGTPPERSEGSVFLSQEKPVVSSMEDKTEGSASRHIDKRTRRRPPPAYDQRAVKLAASVRRDERFPLWVRLIARGRLTAAVTRKAVAGWDLEDVYGAFEEHRVAGRKLYTDPRNPAGYFTWLLREIPDDMPPARLDRAREVALAEGEHAHWRRELEKMRQARMNSTGMNPAARAARDQLAGQTHGKAMSRARQAEYARREITAKG